jgi:hypothetical protein
MRRAGCAILTTHAHEVLCSRAYGAARGFFVRHVSAGGFVSPPQRGRDNMRQRTGRIVGSTHSAGTEVPRDPDLTARRRHRGDVTGEHGVDSHLILRNFRRGRRVHQRRGASRQDVVRYRSRGYRGRTDIQARDMDAGALPAEHAHHAAVSDKDGLLRRRCSGPAPSAVALVCLRAAELTRSAETSH